MDDKNMNFRKKLNIIIRQSRSNIQDKDLYNYVLNVKNRFLNKALNDADLEYVLKSNKIVLHKLDGCKSCDKLYKYWKNVKKNVLNEIKDAQFLEKQATVSDGIKFYPCIKLHKKNGNIIECDWKLSETNMSKFIINNLK
jgi:hypothetical protein